MASQPVEFRLHNAARLGQCNKIKQFLAAGDGVDSVDETGQVAAARILLAKGANPSACDGHGYSPLSIVADGGNIALAKLLIEAGADLNAVFCGGDEGEGKKSGTPLFAAVSKGDQNMTRLLIDAGCDVDKFRADWFPPLVAAAQNGLTEIFNMLLAGGADVNVSGREGVTALQAAAGKGRHALVIRLLQRRALVDLCDASGCGPLFAASHQGSDESVKALLEAGADPNRKETNQSSTPLHTACRHGHRECVLSLLYAKADVAARDVQGFTPLHYGSQNGHTDVIELLLSAGANATALDVNGRSPLVHASLRGHVKAVSLLLDAGVDPNTLNAYGRNAVFGVSNLEVLKVLLSRGGSAKFIGNEGSSVLHYAGSFGFEVGVICELYKAGADPTLLDPWQRTAADVAREEGHEAAAKTIDLLIAKRHVDTRAILHKDRTCGRGRAAAMNSGQV